MNLGLLEPGRWSYYRLGVPKTTVLKCPECGANHICDVDLNDDACTVDEQAVFTARIDTARCEDCQRLLCGKCPQAQDDQGLPICLQCARAQMQEAERLAMLEVTM